jgi:Type IV secretion-system coupling protein DNA-binding domain
MRREYKPPAWPRRYAQNTLVAVGVVLVVTILTARHQRQQLENAYEKWYLWRYALTSYRAAVNDRPRQIEFLVPRGAQFRIRTVTMPPSQYRDALKDSVYGGEPAWRVLWQTVLAFVGSFALFVPPGVWLDRRYRLFVQQGVNRRGPELVSLSEFKGRIRYRRLLFFSRGPDGLTFFLHPDLSPEPKPYRKGLPYIRIRKRDEVMNLGFVGDSGSGKTSLMKQILYQARERGDVAIINDPKREFLTEFYDERRGDILLDPSDERCPYWEFKGELPEWNKEAVAYTIANSILRSSRVKASSFGRTHASSSPI